MSAARTPEEQNRYDRRRRGPVARRRVLDALGSGPRTAEELRPLLRDLGHYGRKQGCLNLLAMLEARGSVRTSRSRQTTTGPLVTLYHQGDPTCRVCGCTDMYGCAAGCSWVEPDLCSRCVGKEV